MLTQGPIPWSILPSSAMTNPSLLRMLATSFLAGQPSADQIAVRASQLLGGSAAGNRNIQIASATLRSDSM
jgi:hypothetical protein